MFRVPLLSLALGLLLLLLVDTSRADSNYTFRDTGEEMGLFPEISGIAGHGAAWGDIDGDGYPELYVGTFASEPYGSKTNRLFLNKGGKKFAVDEQKALRINGRNNGAVFADFDNDGDLDLYVTNHAIDGKPYKLPHFSTPNSLFKNDGKGTFTDVSAASGTCPDDFQTRSVAVLDYDGDGLLDVLAGECFFQGGKGRSKLFRNKGSFKFEDVSRAVGLPEKIVGFGVAAGDVNNDGWPDILFGGRYGGNKLFLNDTKGKFKEVPDTHARFAWTFKDTNEDTPCGVCFGDVNRDGLLDIVIGQHHDRPWYTGGVPVRLFLNKGVEGGWPKFEDVTDKVGLKGLPMKAPHVELRDFDNDGWPDLYTSIVKFAGGKPYPMIFKNQGVKDGLPRFTEDVLSVNDFPTAEDQKMADVTAAFNKMNKDRKIVYMAGGPSGDYDRDGRLDLFLPHWWVDQKSLLLHNETKGGHWLDVSVEGSGKVNRQGIGCKVLVYTAGKLGEASHLLMAVEIAAGYGYASGQESYAHIGLGKAETCDLQIVLSHGQGKLERKAVKADQRLTVK